MENKTTYVDYKLAMRLCKKYPGIKYKRRCWGNGYVKYSEEDKCYYYIRFTKEPGVLGMSKQKYIPSFSDVTIRDWMEVEYSECTYFDSLKKELQK